MQEIYEAKRAEMENEIKNKNIEIDALTVQLSFANENLQSESRSKRQRLDELQTFEPGFDSNQNSGNPETPHINHRPQSCKTTPFKWKDWKHSSNPIPRKSMSIVSESVPNTPTPKKSNIQVKYFKVESNYLTIHLVDK